MDSTLSAIEMTGTIDENRHLQVDEALPIAGPMRVRVIVLYPLIEEWDEADWLRAAANNPAFGELNDPAEDIYSSSDGKPFRDAA